MRQLVLIGGGFDARAFRLNLPELRVFEIDEPSTFAVQLAPATAMEGGGRSSVRSTLVRSKRV